MIVILQVKCQAQYILTPESDTSHLRRESPSQMRFVSSTTDLLR
jgi:hypothetical protein